MQYRSHLSLSERAYADALCPAFDDIKVVLLRVAASTLLWQQDTTRTGAHLEALYLSTAEMRQIGATWSVFVSSHLRRQGPDQHTVGETILAIAEAVEALQHAAMRGERDQTQACMQSLLCHYDTLRQTALSLWPLELVAETCATASYDAGL